VSTRTDSARRIDPPDEIGDPFIPSRHRVVERWQETSDVVTLLLHPVDHPVPPAVPGQFNMVTAFGIGEAAISVSGSTPDGTVRHTVRAVGPVSTALASSRVGEVVGVRGPFGTDWGIGDVGSADVVIIAGGIGLAPLRSVIIAMIDRARSGGGRIFVLVGARTPDDVLFANEIPAWQGAGAQIGVTVDAADAGWRGRVGVVTALIADAGFDPARSIAMICGPEIMMRFSIRSLLDRGVDPGKIRLSLERNMQCGIGLCGHCQLGPLLLCRDGPVVSFNGVVPQLLTTREL
jgi:NAD(P)H-flavin reductase